MGTSATFMVEATGEALSYQWQKQDITGDNVWVDIVDATASEFTILEASFADAGTYRVKVSNAMHEIVSEESNLTVSNSDLAPVSLVGLKIEFDWFCELTRTPAKPTTILPRRRTTGGRTGAGAGNPINGDRIPTLPLCDQVMKRNTTMSA